MKHVKRYNLFRGGPHGTGHYVAGLEKDPNGDYVDYDAYARVAMQNENLRRQLDIVDAELEWKGTPGPLGLGNGRIESIRTLKTNIDELKAEIKKLKE